MKGLLAVLLIATLFLPGCAKKELAKEIVIPPSLRPREVVEEIFPENCFALNLKEEFVDISHAWSGAGEEGFVEGYTAGSYNYTMANGTTIRADPYSESGLPILAFQVLKYENTEFANRSYEGFDEADEVQNLTYRNINLKTFVEPPSKGLSAGKSWGYIIHSSCFVVIFGGLPDVAQDALDRTIATFGV